MSRVDIDRFARPRVSDDGMLFVFGPSGNGLACTVLACDNPECGCREVTIDAVPISRQVFAVEIEGDKIKYLANAWEGFETAEVGSAFRLELDIDTGLLRQKDKKNKGTRRDFWLALLEDAIDGELLEDGARLGLGAKRIALELDEPFDNPVVGDFQPGDLLRYP